MSKNNVDQEIADFTADVSVQTTVVKSAIAIIIGIPALIASAIAAAVAAGATPLQIQAFQDLHTAFVQNNADLQAAITASTNTPAVPVVAVPKAKG